MNSLTKSDIRKKFREICGKVPAVYRMEAAQVAARQLANLPFFQKSERIACYLSTKSEFDTSPIIEAIWRAKKHCYVPVLSEENEKSLHFEHYQYGDALHLNRFSILEPVNGVHKILPENLDMVIVPLISFDRHGHRLGTGGGYYDRTFAFLNAHLSKNPYMVGLAYTVQQVDSLPSDAWDIVLNGVLTEKEFIFCS